MPPQDEVSNAVGSSFPKHDVILCSSGFFFLALRTIAMWQGNNENVYPFFIPFCAVGSPNLLEYTIAMSFRRFMRDGGINLIFCNIFENQCDF